MKTIIKKIFSVIIIVCIVCGISPIISNTNNLVPTTIVAQAAEFKTHIKKKSVKLTIKKTYKQKLISKSGKTISSKNVKWKSSDKKIATISKDGKITAKKIGQTKMTATYKNKKYTFTVTVSCPHKNMTKVITKQVTCEDYGIEKTICADCKTAFSSRFIDPAGHIYSKWTIIDNVSTYNDLTTKRYCYICNEEEFGKATYKPVSANSIAIPSINLNAEYTVGEFNQSSVNNNDILCNYTEWGKDDPVILGHSYNSLGDINSIKVGDYIFYTHDGVTDTYKVTHSEFGIEINGNTNIKGIDTGKVCLYKGDVPTLHMFTCAWHPMYGNHRWMVVAEKV